MPPDDRTHRPARRVGIKDVAARAGVANATVSRVLSGSADVRADLRERVLRAAAELDYQPDILAQSLRRGATRQVGFIADDLSNHLIADIATGAESVLRAHGYSLLVMNSERDPTLDPANLRVLHARRVDALMMCPVEEDDPDTVAALRAINVPLCVIEGDLPPSVPASYVHSDHRDGMAHALRHLVGLGHRRIAVVAGPVRYRSARQRALGLEDVAGERRRGLVLHHVETELTPQAARASTRAALDVPGPPTAIATGGDGSLPGVIAAIDDLGLAIGEDISLVTSDPGDLGPVFRPPLAAITRDGALIGATAAELLLERIVDPRTGARTVILPTVFEPRASVGRVPARRGAGPVRSPAGTPGALPRPRPATPRSGTTPRR
ncbi:MAG: LacI family DNA-binding transcriptional regulator [Candidatus Limnocylindrales bacterium]